MSAARKREYITPQQALDLVKEFFNCDAEFYTLATIYRKVCVGELGRFGPRHKLLLDKDEVLNKLCRHYGK